MPATSSSSSSTALHAFFYHICRRSTDSLPDGKATILLPFLGMNRHRLHLLRPLDRFSPEKKDKSTVVSWARKIVSFYSLLLGARLMDGKLTSGVYCNIALGSYSTTEQQTVLTMVGGGFGLQQMDMLPVSVSLSLRHEYEDKMKEKSETPVIFSYLGPPRRLTGAEEDDRAKPPKPEDSVYYYPTLNPTGAPPPGKLPICGTSK